MKLKNIGVLSGAALFFAGSTVPFAIAHTGGNSMASGLSHPLVGLDHLLALLGVSLWAARYEGRAKWLLPMAFLGSLLAGSLLGLSKLSLPLVEPMIAASVLFFGLVLLPRTQAAPWLAALLAGGFAIFHGHAHGNEFVGAAPVTFVAGMLFTSALLIAACTMLSVGIHKLQGGWIGRVAGLGLAASGAWMMS